MLVPTDLPDRVAARGVPVHVVGGWESHGGNADHGAVVFHWTASSSNESPSSCANYSFYAADNSPHYNVIVDRVGECWIGARKKANSSGNISGVALNETLAGQSNVDSAASRGLPDTTSANDRLFAISAQNNGTSESWSAALVDNMSIVCAVVLESLGLTVGHLCHHAQLTARKIDLSPGPPGCPPRDIWYQKINDALGGGPARPAHNLVGAGMFICFGPGGAALAGPGYFNGLTGEAYEIMASVPGMVVKSANQREFDVIRAACLHGTSADDEPLT